MAIIRQSRAFKDISLSFKRHPVTNDSGVIKNENAIIRSVRNLVQTIPKERFFNPLLGSDVRSTLFDTSAGFIDFGTASIIERQIQTTIENFEPRIDNLEIAVDPRPETNEFEVRVFFDIIGQAFPTQEFSFILKATR